MYGYRKSKKYFSAYVFEELRDTAAGRMKAPQHKYIGLREE